MTVTPISYLASHSAQERQQQASKPGRPGPKPVDYSDLIGQRSGRIVVIDVLPRDEKRHTNLICSCDCGKFCTVRASDFTARDVKSCDCLQKEQFNAYQRQRAENLNADVCRAIFLDSAKTGSWKGADVQVAARHKVSKYVIRFACRLHKERLLAKYDDTLRGSRGIQRTQLSKTLDEIEYRWLLKNTGDVSVSGIEIEWDDLPTWVQEKLSGFVAADAAEKAAHAAAEAIVAAKPLKPAAGSYLNCKLGTFDPNAHYYDDGGINDLTVSRWMVGTTSAQSFGSIAA